MTLSGRDSAVIVFGGEERWCKMVHADAKPRSTSPLLAVSKQLQSKDMHFSGSKDKVLRSMRMMMVNYSASRKKLMVDLPILQSQHEKPKVIPRILPRKVGQLLAVYLGYVQPFQEYLSVHVKGSEWSDYIWANE